jgi:predicted metal-dependent phosphoesterase TrpH
MVAADLHVHTTNSDGTLSVADVCEAARAADLAAVAITDHDRLHPDLAAPVAARDGLTVVHGIELRVETGDQRLDLLGYGARPTPALTAELDRLQADRVERGRAIVANVEAALGVDLDVAIEPGLGRPDIARVVAAHPDTDYTVQDVFDELIGDGQPCYVAREVPGFERGRDLLADACALVGLAHPLRYDDPAAAMERAATLDAVELHYPYADDPDLEPVREAAARHDLLITGGSDAHDDGVGRAGLDAAEWARVCERLPAADP